MLNLIFDLLIVASSAANYHEYRKTGQCHDCYKKQFKERDRMRHNYQPGEVDYPAITSQFMRR